MTPFERIDHLERELLTQGARIVKLAEGLAEAGRLIAQQAALLEMTIDAATGGDKPSPREAASNGKQRH